MPSKLQGATVKVDSEYNEQFAAAHLLDDVPGTAWASGGTPMPHWAEITLPEPAEVQAVEVVSRQGPYLVTDVDIELPDGDGWRVAKSIRGATDRKIVARLDAPATTHRIRVSILHELYEGRDRSYADVESIRVLDPSGRNRARSAIEPVRVSGAVEGELPPSAVAVAPTTAEVLARFDHPDHPPAVLRNRFGNGQALLVTCTAVPSDGPFWTSLCKLTLGEPAFLVSADDQRAVSFHSHPRRRRARPARDRRRRPGERLPTEIGRSLSRGRGALAGGARRRWSAVTRPSRLSEKDGRLHFTVQPAPVATVVLK